MRSPADAPPRTDLPWLRRRVRPSVVKAAPPETTRAVADFLSTGGHPRHPTITSSSSLDLTAPAAPTLDLSRPSPAPTGSSSLDLSAPTPAAPLDLSRPAPPASAGSSSLDLSAPTPPAPSGPTTPAASSSLDLGAAPIRPSGPSGGASLDLGSGSSALSNAPFKPTPRPLAAYQPPRVKAGQALVLRQKSPTVTLTRVQSGVGALVIEAACSPAVGDLRLGVAYQLTNGSSSLVQRASDIAMAPPGSRRPLILAQRQQFEKVTLDLRQVRSLQRCLVYAYSEGGGSLNWGGTLVATTFGQARIELPLDRPPSPAVAVLLSIYQVDGELVIRAENDDIAGTVRDAVVAYGFDRITWLDPRTPLV